MKAKQYVTLPGCHLKENNVYATNVKVPAIMKIVTSKEAFPNTFDGFGVAITGSSCYELNTMDKELRKKVISDVYGKNGLDLSIGRLSMGSSDYSAELYSYNEVSDDLEMKNFSLEQDEEYIIPMIKEILEEKSDIKLFASPWSPPGWMKTGGSIYGGHMRDKYIEPYTKYFLKFLQGYEKHGIKIDAVTPQNEPETSQFGTSVACVWSPETEAKFAIALRNVLKENGFDTEIWLHDHDFAYWPKLVWMLEEYPELLEVSGNIAMHYYTGSIKMLNNIKEKFPEVKIHFTEGGPRLYDNYGTDWCKWGIIMAQVLNTGLKSFCGWNLMLDETGGPNIGPFFCGGLITLNSQSGEISYSGQYHALSHFSRFIKKDAKIYKAWVNDCGDNMFQYPNTQKLVECCAAENTDGSFVLQIINPDKVKAQLQYEYDGKLWYIEALPESVNTVVFNK